MLYISNQWLYSGLLIRSTSSTIIQDIQGIHTARLAAMVYHYFDFCDVKKQDRYGLLSSLLFQLSADSDSCCEVLS